MVNPNPSPEIYTHTGNSEFGFTSWISNQNDKLGKLNVFWRILSATSRLCPVYTFGIHGKNVSLTSFLNINVGMSPTLANE